MQPAINFYVWFATLNNQDNQFQSSSPYLLPFGPTVNFVNLFIPKIKNPDKQTVLIVVINGTDKISFLTWT